MNLITSRYKLSFDKKTHRQHLLKSCKQMLFKCNGPKHSTSILKKFYEL